VTASGLVDTKEVLTLDEAAELLRVCTRTVLKLARAGKLGGRQLNGPKSPWRFTRTKLLEWCNGNRAA
jgi:excisionase family DNA binding protein